MCGVFAYVGSRPDAVGVVYRGIKDLDYRGYDSWGLGVVSKGKIFIKKDTGKVEDGNVENLPNGNVVFGHTRWATHGDVSVINAHPQTDCFNKVAVCHNGIFENYQAIKKNLVKSGHIFRSNTDTEVVAHLIESLVDKHSFEESVRIAFRKMKGLNALCVVCSKTSQIAVVRNGSPLVIGLGLNESFVSSDILSIVNHTHKVCFLENNTLALIDSEKIVFTDVRTGKQLNPNIEKIHLKQRIDNTKGIYKDCMSKEIFEQPEVIKKILNNKLSELRKISNIISKSKNVYLLGCGSASYVANAGSYLFSEIANKHTTHIIGSEFSLYEKFISIDDLLIALSQSGETMDILIPVNKMKKRGLKVLAIVNSIGSTLYRKSDYKLYIEAGQERAVASTKAVTAKLTCILLLAYLMSGEYKKGFAVLSRAQDSVSEVLKEKNLESIKKVAKYLINSKSVYVLGRGSSYPVGLETALKIKEISYIHAEAFPAGELKHGPLALISDGVPCIFFLPNDAYYDDNVSSIMEVKARGGKIIAISNKANVLFDYFLSVADAGPATILAQIVTGQLLAYYTSVGKGLDPDKPRNLAKSVTVK